MTQAQTKEKKKAKSTKVVLLKDLGPSLPLGVQDTSGAFHKEIAVRPWRMKEERELGAIRDAHRDSNFASYVSMVLGTMCTKLGPHDLEGKELVDKQILVGQMFMADVLYAYIWLRVQSMGPNLNVEVKCPSCDGTFPFSADLNTLEVTVADDLKSSLWDYMLKTPFKGRGRDLKALRMGPTRWNAMESSKAGSMNLGEMKADIIRYSIHEASFDGETYEAVPLGQHELDEMTKLDLESLSTLIDENSVGPNMAIEDKCRLCSKPFKTSIDWGYDSFFATSSP